MTADRGENRGLAPGTEVKESMAIRNVGNLNPTGNGAQPALGGQKVGGTADARLEEAYAGPGGHLEGQQAVFILARRGGGPRTTPVWGVNGGQRTVAVFTTRERAILYAQVAGWQGDMEPASLSPPRLADWLRDARAADVQFAAVDPDRQSQFRGEPQPALALAEMADLPDGDLFRAVRGAGQGAPVD